MSCTKCNGLLAVSLDIYKDIMKNQENAPYFPNLFYITVDHQTGAQINAVEVEPPSAEKQADPGIVTVIIRPQILSLAHASAPHVLLQARSFLDGLLGGSSSAASAAPSLPAGAASASQALVYADSIMSFLGGIKVQDNKKDSKYFKFTHRFSLGDADNFPAITAVKATLQVDGAFEVIDEWGYHDNTLEFDISLITNVSRPKATIKLDKDKDIHYSENEVSFLPTLADGEQVEEKDIYRFTATVEAVANPEAEPGGKVVSITVECFVQTTAKAFNAETITSAILGQMTLKLEPVAPGSVSPGPGTASQSGPGVVVSGSSSSISGPSSSISGPSSSMSSSSSSSRSSSSSSSSGRSRGSATSKSKRRPLG
jgi:hypothetical protein